MAVVVDANLVVALATNDPRSGSVERRVREWLDGREDLHAPALLPYEVASGFARLVAAGRLAAQDLPDVWALVDRLPLHLHHMTAGPSVVEAALHLGPGGAYRAAYVVLAQQLGAELWTLDGPLAGTAAALGLPVRLVE